MSRMVGKSQHKSADALHHTVCQVWAEESIFNMSPFTSIENDQSVDNHFKSNTTGYTFELPLVCPHRCR